jgi:hypothetical protein
MAENKTRLALGEILETIEPNCYFQPGSNVRMSYPCIVYKFKTVDTDEADNKKYRMDDVYEITHVYKSPSSEKRKKFLGAFDFIHHDRQFINDGLYHDVFTLYF